MSEEEERYVDVRGAMRMLGLGRSKVYLLMESKQLEWTQPPTVRKRLIKVSSIKALLENGQKTCVAPTAPQEP